MKGELIDRNNQLICADDIDNQSAPAIAREYDSQGLRTIGIRFLDEKIYFQAF
jgi:hypothetical protein